MKNTGKKMGQSKEQNKSPETDPKEMEICEFSDNKSLK